MEKKINLEIYCITNKRLEFLENTSYNLGWVGESVAPKNYLQCNNGINIFYKEKYYSELTFQYWYWKNILKKENQNWIGFCQKRRFWLKNNDKISSHEKDDILDKILFDPKLEWNNYQSIICKPVNVNKIKKIKMIKRNYKSLIKNPKPFFFQNSRTINFHFDMHHGYKNLDRAINLMDINDREEFRKYVNTNTSFNPHIMFISKNVIIDKWFTNLFKWLFECEKIFGFKELKGYDTMRLYAYLAERYLSFWFKKYTKYLEWEWIFFDKNK